MSSHLKSSLITRSSPYKSQRLSTSLCLNGNVIDQISQSTIIPHVLQKFHFHNRDISDPYYNSEVSHTSASLSAIIQKTQKLSILVIVNKLQKIGRMINGKQLFTNLKTKKLVAVLKRLQYKTNRNNLLSSFDCIMKGNKINNVHSQTLEGILNLKYWIRNKEKINCWSAFRKISQKSKKEEKKAEIASQEHQAIAHIPIKNNLKMKKSTVRKVIRQNIQPILHLNDNFNKHRFEQKTFYYYRQNYA